MIVQQSPNATSLRLRDADAPLRSLITAFLIVLTVGYSIGLLFVDHTSSGSIQGLIEQFRGTPENSPAPELTYSKTADEMYIFLHNHILSLSLVFFAVGFIFYFHSMPPGLIKYFLLVEPFVAIITTFGGIWSMWYVSAYFSWLVMISGVSMVLCYFTMVVLILKELWRRR